MTPALEKSAELKTLEELITRASAAGIETELVIYEGDELEGQDPGYVRLSIPNGRFVRILSAAVGRAQRLLAIDFESLGYLGDYEAVVVKSTGAIEALVEMTSSAVGLRPGPWTLPGVEILDPKIDLTDETADADLAPSLSRRPERWRLRVEDRERSIEISPASETAKAVWAGAARGVTLKLDGFTSSTHDKALELLERHGGAFLFELDVLYGVSWAVQRRRSRPRRTKRQRSEAPPSFPLNEYARESLALYQYARTASGLPLLEYLAYYQSLEYFFPVFAREQTVKSLRTALLNPTFNPTDDTAVSRLINLSAPAVRAGLGEREQLRATVRACVEVDELRELISLSEEHAEHFCSKKQAIKGVLPLRLDGDHTDLRDQVADRIYAIRCRVVHTKQDGGGPGDDLLLPSGNEADSLAADIDLVRLVAQRALFARASRP